VYVLFEDVGECLFRVEDDRNGVESTGNGGQSCRFLLTYYYIDLRFLKAFKSFLIPSILFRTLYTDGMKSLISFLPLMNGLSWQLFKR
jgi:hypothetical protein